MAWTLPLDATAWTPHPWQQLAVLNECIRATNMRLLSIDEAGQAATTPLVERAIGDDIQSTLEDFRNESFRWDAGSGLANLSAGQWVKRAAIAIGNDAAAELVAQAYRDATGWTQLFVDDVNAQLTAWSLPTMGASPLSGEIPWTRKYGDRTAWTDDEGPQDIGDWFGGHLYNEWRACLEVLNCLAVDLDITDGDPDDFRQHSGGAVEEDSCEDARAAVASAWAATSLPMSPPGVRAYGNINGFSSVDASATVEWQPYSVTLPSITNGTARIYAEAGVVTGGYDFDDFGYGWTQDEIGQIESTAANGAAFTFEIDPFPDGTYIPTDDIPCPTEDGQINRSGFEVEVTGLVVDIDYPAP